MSSAWEILEKQNKEKVDDIATWEARFSRLSVEVSWSGVPLYLEDPLNISYLIIGQKAKAEQKYFGTMREREALEAERKASNRSLQQQTLLIGKMTETQDVLQKEIVCLISL